MIDDKYKFTGDIDQITLKEGNPLEAYLQDGTKLTSKDMGDYYAYSNGNNLWRVPKLKPKIDPAKDIDKVILGTMALGISPLAAPELFGSLVTNIAQNPQLWGQALQRTAAGMAGYEGVNELNKQINGETWGEGIHRLSRGKVPVWLGDLTNPGGFLEGAATNVGNKLLNNVAEEVSKSTAPFLLYREISRSNPNTLLIFPGLIGWTPRNTFSGYHASNESAFNPDYFFNGWVLKTHGAPHGVYFAEGTKPASGFLTKRPYVHQRQFTFDKPQILIGEVVGISKNGIRNQIERNAQLLGADGIIYSGIADNLMKNQIIYKTLHPDVTIESPMQMKGSYGIEPYLYFKKNADGSFMRDTKGNTILDTNKVINDIKLGKLNLIDLIKSPEYAETMLSNAEEASSMGLKYIPLIDKPAFLAFVEKSIKPIFKYEPKSSWNGRTSWSGVNPTDNSVIIEYNLGNPKLNLVNTTQHEGGHASLLAAANYMDELPYLRYKISKIFKPDNLTPPWMPYDFNLQTGEAATNMIDFGKDLGITRHTPYPGYDEMIKLMLTSNSDKKGIIEALNLSSENGPDIWKALQGLYLFGKAAPRIGIPKYTSSISPLEARLARLQEKVKEGVIPETKLLGLVGKDLTPIDIRNALKELDPNLTDKLIQGAVLVAMAKKLGVHIPFGTETTTDAGLSIVDVMDAVKLLRKHGVTNPTSKDIENIIAHEFGHSTAYEIPEDVRPLLQGYYDPNEFFTLAGLILDNAGIKETINNPVSYKDFMDMLAQYLSQGNLDNGISLLADFMKLFSATSGNRWKDASTIVKRNKLMKYINSLSAGLYGAYLINNE